MFLISFEMPFFVAFECNLNRISTSFMLQVNDIWAITRCDGEREREGYKDRERDIDEKIKANHTFFICSHSHSSIEFLFFFILWPFHCELESKAYVEFHLFRGKMLAISIIFSGSLCLYLFMCMCVRMVRAWTCQLFTVFCPFAPM